MITELIGCFFSTCATYGIPDQVPISEDRPQRSINPYGLSKLTSEQILRDFEFANRVRSTSLRFFNAAGVHLNGEIGESHAPETHLLSFVLDALAGKRQAITFFGDDYDTYDVPIFGITFR